MWHFSKLRTLVRSHRNTSVSYREIFFKQISKEYIYLFYPWVFTRLFHTSLNSAHMALKPNYKEYLKTEPRFFFSPCHNIYTRHSAQTGCAENRILFRAFTVLYIYSAAHVIHQAIPFQQTAAVVMQKSSLEYEKCKKCYYVVSVENQSISAFSYLLCQVTLIRFLWLKIGPEGEAELPYYYE